MAVDTGSNQVYVSNFADNSVTMLLDTCAPTPPTRTPTSTPTRTRTPTQTPTLDADANADRHTHTHPNADIRRSA